MSRRGQLSSGTIVHMQVAVIAGSVDDADDVEAQLSGMGADPVS
jgi:hypothetical protein